MISLRNILTISKFETKVLWRNWFFRIFGIGILFFLTILNLAGFSSLNDDTWHLYSITWGGPYANMIMLSIGQAAAVIFLATGLIKRDKKIDTNEVFMVRPVSNIDYVLGKALAVFKLFIALNIVILTLNLVINLTNPYSGLNGIAYVIYPLLTSVPSIIFLTGFGFLMVTLIRNQPITIVLMIGLSVVILIYFHEYSNVLDYMAFRYSMMASDIAGFNNLKAIILQRVFYLLTGVTCLFATALFLGRLPNNVRFKYSNLIITVIFAAISSYVMVELWATSRATSNLREQVIALNGQWNDVPNIEITANSVELEHMMDEIKATSRVKIRNQNEDRISQIYFTLNPGLEIQNVSVNDLKVEFIREMHIISINLEKSLSSGEESEIVFDYAGKILDDIAHLDVNPERLNYIDDYFVYSVHKQFAFLQPDYVLLTKDVMWYPDTQIGYSKQSPVKERTSFINFELQVKVNGNLTAISQGDMETDNLGTFYFRPQYPIPQISLAIGLYEKLAILVDSIEYSIYHYPDNDYFTDYLNHLPDTLNHLIRDLRNEYEHDQQIKYPFSRLQLVEVPIQFRAFNKIYEGHQAYIQPEMVLMPEKGGDIRALDLRRQMRNMTEQAREQNLVLSDKEKQANVFKDLVKRVLTKQVSDRYFFDGREPDEPNYSIFANLYAYNTGIVSTEWPLFNKSVSNFFNSESLPVTDFSRNINGISFTEDCNKLMRSASIMEILTMEEEFNKIQKSISLKGEYLFSQLSQLMGEEELKSYLYDWINSNNHRLTKYSDFRKGVEENFGLDVDPVIRRTFFDTSQPAFVISDLEQLQILDEDRNRYQVIFEIKNTGATDGVVKINFHYWEEEREFQFFGPSEEEEDTDQPGHLSLIHEGEKKQFGFVLDNPPDQISINTLVSQNIPSIVRIDFSDFRTRPNFTPFIGEKIIETEPVPQGYEVIVDDEDAGFSTFSPIKDTYLRAYLDSRDPSDKKFYGSWRRSYSDWLATTGSDFYGDYIRSAHFTRAGKGEKLTTWEPNLRESGFYDIYVYMKGKNQNEYVGRNNEDKKYTYEYQIHHGDGLDEIRFDLSKAERGWNYLGSYYFQSGDGNIVLTDKCELRTVYADAIKWVKQL